MLFIGLKTLTLLKFISIISFVVSAVPFTILKIEFKHPICLFIFIFFLFLKNILYVKLTISTFSSNKLSNLVNVYPLCFK